MHFTFTTAALAAFLALTPLVQSDSLGLGGTKNMCDWTSKGEPKCYNKGSPGPLADDCYKLRDLFRNNEEFYGQNARIYAHPMRYIQDTCELTLSHNANMDGLSSDDQEVPRVGTEDAAKMVEDGWKVLTGEGAAACDFTVVCKNLNDDRVPIYYTLERTPEK